MSKSKTRKKINNYIIHLDEPLGSGAYATVYKAHDEQSNAFFAAKIIDRAKSMDA
jgi:serine/threonine protein kinase